MPTPTKAELEHENEVYKEWKAEWNFYIRSYLGGKHYRDGNYLVKHPLESENNFTRRKSSAYFYNYCQPIVDIFVSHLYKDKPIRDFGSLTNDALFESFLVDADLEGTSWHEFIKVAQRCASTYGRISVVVDKPTASAATKAEAEEFDIRPYVSLVTPENILDWRFIRLPSGRPVLDMIKIRELKTKNEARYRIWTRVGWELWEINKAGKVNTLGAGPHDLGEVPVVNLYNKRGGLRMVGLSDLKDIADINKNIYYLCSDAKEIIENTAFPMLALPFEKGGKNEETKVGTNSIQEFDATEPNAKPFWLEPPHTSLPEIREWVDQDTTEIFRIASMGGIKTTETSVQPWSGAALAIQNQRLSSILSQKADLAEEAELAILRLWAKWQDKEFDGKIEYLRKYDLKDVTTELQNAMNAQKARVDSVAYAKELQKKIVITTLPNADDEKRKEIFDEIEAAEVTTEPVVDNSNNVQS